MSLTHVHHSTGFSRIDLYPSTVWRGIHDARILAEIERWAPVLVAFVWLAFFGYTNETRRLYGPMLRRLWESTPFATHRPTLEPLTFGSASVKDRRGQGDTSDSPASFSSINYSTPIVMDQKDEGIKAPVTTVLMPPDVESQHVDREGTQAGGRSRLRWRSWLKGIANP